MNSATGPEVAPSIPYLVVPSPQVQFPVVTSILGREVLAVDGLVPVVGDVQVRVVIDRAPVVDVIDCWSQTWAMTSQKSHRSIPSQLPPQSRRHPLRFRLSNSSINNSGGSLLKRRRRGCTRVPWLGLNRYKVSSRYLPLNQAHRLTRYVESSGL